MRRGERSGEKGMLTVEAVLSLVPFIIVILGIISLINLFIIHNKIQFAIQQVGNELTCYTYFYQALGLRAGDRELNSEMDKQTEQVDQTLEDLTGFFEEAGRLKESAEGVADAQPSDLLDSLKEVKEGLESTGEAGKTAFHSVKEAMKDPKQTLRGVIYLLMEKGEEKLKSLLAGVIVSGMAESYLSNTFLADGAMTADAYLKKFGVRDGMDGLDFGKSSLFSKDAPHDNLKFRMIDIVVEYDVEVYILKLFFKDPTIHVVQRCAVPAWLDGDGQSYYE